MAFDYQKRVGSYFGYLRMNPKPAVSYGGIRLSLGEKPGHCKAASCLALVYELPEPLLATCIIAHASGSGQS